MSNEYWIVTTHQYRPHPTLEAAQAEMARLLEKHPTKQFRVMRCKHILTRSDHFNEMIAVLQGIVDGGATSEALETARGLLGRIRERAVKP